MFKKNLWIAGLILAVAIVFSGCLDPLEEEDQAGQVLTTVFDLSASLQTLTVGQIQTQTAFNTKFGTEIPALQACGGIPEQVTYEVKDSNGIKVLSVNAIATWGAGIDVKNSVIQFKAGDTIYIKGTVDVALNSGNGICVSAGPNAGNDKITNWKSNATTGAFETTLTLTAAEVAKIQGGGPPVIRIRPDSGQAAQFTLQQVRISGMRPAGSGPSIPPEFDTAGYAAATALAPSNFTQIYGGNRSINWDENGEFTRLPGAYGSSLFTVALPTFTEDIDDADTIVIKFRALKTTSTKDVKLTRKAQTAASTYADVPNREADGSAISNSQYLTIAAVNGYEAQLKAPGKYYNAVNHDFDNFKYVLFQDNSDSDAAWKMKITGIEIKRQDKDPVTLRAVTYTPPVAGGARLTSFNNAQFDGAITWAGSFATKTNSAGQTVYDGSQTYTPTITLTAVAGYIFSIDNLSNNTTSTTVSFTVNGSTVSVPIPSASTTTLTFVGPVVTTGPLTPSPASGAITFATRSGAGTAASPYVYTTYTPVAGVLRPALTAPGFMLVPNTQVSAASATWMIDNPAYDSTIAEDPSNNPALITPSGDRFAAGTSYVLQVVLNSFFGTTFVGQTLTVDGATVSVVGTPTADAITLNVRYPATQKTVDSLTIGGITAPAKGATPVRTVTDVVVSGSNPTVQWTGTVRWFRASDNAELKSGTFAASTAYKAVIFLTIKDTAYTFYGLPQSSWTVTGGTVGYSGPNSGTIEVNPYAATGN